MGRCDGCAHNCTWHAYMLITGNTALRSNNQPTNPPQKVPIKPALLCHIQKFREVQLRLFNIAICSVNDHIPIYGCTKKS